MANAIIRFVVLLGLTLAASACTCLPREFPEHYCDADSVIEVQFTSQRTSTTHVVYTGRVEKVHKGRIFQR